MRFARTLALMSALVVGECEIMTMGDWQGESVHLVDGTWIGAEVDCADNDVTCRTVVDLAEGALAPDLRAKVSKAVLATIPNTFVTTAGETRTAGLGAGILTREAVVLDFLDGTRRVIGLWCYLPSTGSGTLQAELASCELAPLDYWLDGNAPPSISPGAAFG